MDTTIDHDTQAALDALEARIAKLEGDSPAEEEVETEETEEVQY